MNSDAEYPLQYSKEKYVMLRRSVFDAMQTRIDDLEVKLAATKHPALRSNADHDKRTAWWFWQRGEGFAKATQTKEQE